MEPSFGRPPPATMPTISSMKRPRRRETGSDGGAMQAALAVLQEPQTPGERRCQLDTGQRLAVSGERRGDDRLHPLRDGGDPGSVSVFSRGTPRPFASIAPPHTDHARFLLHL